MNWTVTFVATVCFNMTCIGLVDSYIWQNISPIDEFLCKFQIDCLGPSRRQRNGGVSKHHSGQQTDFTSQLSKLFLPFSLFPSSRRRSHNHHPARRRSSLHPIRNAASTSSKQPSSLHGRQQPHISFPRRKRKNSATATSKFAKKIQTVRHSEVKFSCKNRPPGYYADVNEGCRVSFSSPKII